VIDKGHAVVDVVERLGLSEWLLYTWVHKSKATDGTTMCDIRAMQAELVKLKAELRRTPAELPYFAPLIRLPKDFIDIEFAFSWEIGKSKRYVQDAMRGRAADLADSLKNDNTYFYVCGLKSM
jgi:Transposase